MKNKLQIKKPALFNFKIFPEFNGTLVPFYTNSFFPKNFKLKRFFTLYGKKNILELIMHIKNVRKL